MERLERTEHDGPMQAPKIFCSVVVVVACGGSSPSPLHPAAKREPAAARTVDTVASSAKITGLMYLADGCDQVKGNPEAIAAFTRACDAKDAEGCFELSLRYQCGKGVARDSDQAAQFAARACDYGAAAGCGNVASLLGAGPNSEPTRAFAYAERGCRLGNPLACGLVGVFYWQGIGVTADPAKAAQIFEDQCQRSNMMACANLAVELYMGQGVARDLARARTLADGACSAKMDAACNILGAILVEEGGDANVDRALDEFEKLCNRDQGVGCDNLGQLYARGGGRHPPDPGKARAAFQRACDLENALGCTHLGQVAAGS
jgi:TPR repeat protein